MNVIFDMDGLMFDTEKVFIMAWDYAGEKMGIGKAGYMVYKTLGMNIVSSYNVWKEEFGDRYNQEELRKYTKEFLQNYYSGNKVPVKKGLYNLLSYLKDNDCNMAVASSSPRWEVEKHLKDAGIYDYFTGIVCGDMVQNSKPNPEIYLKACEGLLVEPSEAIGIEDSINGVKSSAAAGLYTIMVVDLIQPTDEIKELAAHIFDSLIDVKNLLEGNK